MPLAPGRPLPDHFADLPDPRTGRATRHRLLDLVTIAVCGVDGRVAVEHLPA